MNTGSHLAKHIQKTIQVLAKSLRKHDPARADALLAQFSAGIRKIQASQAGHWVVEGVYEDNYQIFEETIKAPTADAAIAIVQGRAAKAGTCLVNVTAEPA